jgi:glutamate-1-semialdehyde 2,1-aminomutase
LIFDEVMTGFRLAKGGAQELYGIQADLVTFGKVLGGGMPMAAFGGKKEIMNHIAPAGKVYQAGTLSGNPISVAAGIQTLTLLHNDESIYKRLNLKAQLLQMELKQVFLSKGITHTINQVGSMISVFFGITSATNFNEVSQSDIPMFNKFFHHMLDNGVYLPPSAYETWFLSDSLTENDIDYTVNCAQKFLK